MSERTRILERLERAHRAKAWCGPALGEALDGVTAPLAAKRPMKGVHTIWELVEHVASWNEIVAGRLEGVNPKTMPVTPEWNYPPVVRTTPAAWKATRRRLARTEARLKRAIAAFPVARIGRRRPRFDYTWDLLINGQIEHILYHTGQIAMLRRALGKPLKG